MPAKGKARKAPARVQVAIRLPPDVLGAARRRAREDRRTLTSHIELLIARDNELPPARPR